jgi:hypothetical protein
MRLRLDNGAPWGSTGDLPTDLALWLIGLGVGVVYNPPRSPFLNGVVERSQGTGKSWAEPHACDTPDELQRHLETMDGIQREEYPYRNGASRRESLPELKHSGRPYDAAWEAKHWSFSAVLDHLAEYAVPRRVDQKGLVSIYNRNHYVGKIHHGKIVHILFDPEAVEWIFADERGQQLRRKPAEEITPERIMKLNVSQHRARG